MTALFTTPALAQSEVQLAILGLNDDLTQMLVRVTDADQGTLLQIREIQTDKVKKGYFVDNKNDERKRLKRLKRSRFKVEATVDQSDPEGRYTVIGAPDKFKKHYDIMVLRNGRVGLVGQVPLKKDGDAVAKAMLKEVVWAPGGKLILAVVNQKLKTERGLEDIDTIHSFSFRKWRVKWVKPETDSGAEAAP